MRSQWILLALLIAQTSLAADDSADPIERCRALRHREPKAAIEVCEQAFTQAQAKQQLDVADEMLFHRSDAEVASGDFAAAAHTLDRVAAQPSSDARWLHAFRLARRRGILAYKQEHIVDALPYFREARALAVAHNDNAAQAQSWNDIGNALRRVGDYQQALEAFLASLDLKRRGGEQQLGPVLNNLGDLYRDLGDYPAAATRYREALVEHERAGHSVDAAHTLSDLAALELDAGERTQATEDLNRALIAFQAAGARSDELRVYAQLARAALADELPDRARDWVQRGLALASEIDQAPTPELALQAARVRRVFNDVNGARTILQDALKRLEVDSIERIPLLEALADASEAVGDNVATIAALREFHRADAQHRDAESSQRLQQLRTRFEVAEKDREIRALSDESRLRQLALQQRTTQLQLLIVLALFSLSLTVLWFYRRQQTTRIATAAREAQRAEEVAQYRREAEELRLDSQRLQAALAGGPIVEDEKSANDEMDAATIAPASETPGIDPHDFRRQLVDLMLTSVECWERASGKTRIDLAEKSRVWRITIDEGRLRVRAMERYLSLGKLPRQPRWRDVLRTAYFVLAECALNEAEREELKRRVDALKRSVRERAMV